MQMSFFDKAIEHAKQADIELKEKGKDHVGILHGVPISIKDNINVKGLDSTCGTQARCFVPKSNHSPLVQSLIDAGAIPFVKSNIPQSLMVPESSNRIFGQAKNPWNTERTPGGSSGGEGVLISTRCSPFGIGTDIGGSIRIPANFCGIYGFKPTPERVTHMGITAPRVNDRSGQLNICASAGPLARCVSDLKLILQAWWGDDKNGDTTSFFKYDRFIPPLPFKLGDYQNPKKKVKRIGYITYNGFFESAQPYIRAVEIAKEKLEKLGYELIEFEVPEPNEFIHVYCAILSADGGMNATIGGLLGEPLLDEYKEVKFISSIPRFLRRIISKVLLLKNEYRKSEIIVQTGKKSVLEFWQVLKRLKAYREMFTEKMKEQNIDALIACGGTVPAFYHGQSTRLMIGCCDTFLFNLLHYPAGCVPVTVVQEHETNVYHDRNADDTWSREAEKCMINSTGLPIGVQVITLPYTDELCVGLMGELEKEIGFNKRPSWSPAM